MPNIDDCAKVVPSPRFERALYGDLQWLEETIVDFVVRITWNPYEPNLVRMCQLRPPDDLETFVYRSPKGFELYWDVELKEADLPCTSDMRIILTELKSAAYDDGSGEWLNYPHY